MVSDANKESRKHHVFWFVIIGIIVVLVGAIIAVVIVKNLTPPAPVSEYDVTPEKIEKAETLQEIRQKVASAESWEEYIDGKISEYEDTEYALEIKTIKIYRLLLAGRINDALKILDAINVDDLNDYDKMQYYLAMTETNRSAGDATAVEKYTKLADEARKKYYENFEGAGGE